MSVAEDLRDAADSIAKVKAVLEEVAMDIRASNTVEAKKDLTLQQLSKITSSLKCLVIDANVLAEYYSNTKAWSVVDQNGDVRPSSQIERYMVCQRQYLQKEGIRLEDL